MKLDPRKRLEELKLSSEVDHHMSEYAPRLTSTIAAVDADTIYVRGENLVDLIGRLSFTEMIFLLIRGRVPQEPEVRILDACLVALVEHGLTPSALVARMTYSAAPDALQGAVAAGLLGVGSTVAGSMVQCGAILSRLNADGGAGSGQGRTVAEFVAASRRDGDPIPGLGHRLHRAGDPRVEPLLALAEEAHVAGRHIETLRLLAAEVERQSGRHIPINVTGAIAAVLMDIGFEFPILRGFALISRSAGLVAHIDEERKSPLTPNLKRIIEA